MFQGAPNPPYVKPDDMAEESMVIVFVGASMPPDQTRAQIAGPYEGEDQRREQRNTHRYGKGAEESSRNAGDRQQRKEYNDRGQRRPDQWNGKLLQRTGCCGQRPLSRIPM